MAEILTENILTLAGAARHISQQLSGVRYSPVTLWRWATTGSLAADGQRIHLEHARLGRRIVTSQQALARFSQRLGRTPTDKRTTDNVGIDDAKSSLQSNGFYS